MADLHFRPLRERQSLGDQIYELLRDDIVYMRLLPGQMIYENEIAERLDVSRTPVREAFRLLASEQLIDIQPQRGTRIALISVRKVSETWFVREQLEKGAFGLAARFWKQNIDNTQDSLLDKLIAEQEETVINHDTERLLKLDEDFHRLIMQAAGNQTLLQVIFQMRAHINRVRFLSLQESNDLGLIVAEHRELLLAIRSGNVRHTIDLLDEHFSRLNDELPELREKHPDFFTSS